MEKQKNKKIETAKLNDIPAETGTIENCETKKIKLNSYHSKEYLERKRKSLGEVIFILPNGKEF